VLLPYLLVQRRDELEHKIAAAKEFPEICRLQGALIEVLKLANMPETDALIRAAEAQITIEYNNRVLSRTERRKQAIPGAR
jgi:hypothetical protein